MVVSRNGVLFQRYSRIVLAGLHAREQPPRNGPSATAARCTAPSDYDHEKR